MQLNCLFAHAQSEKNPDYLKRHLENVVQHQKHVDDVHNGSLLTKRPIAVVTIKSCRDLGVKMWKIKAEKAKEHFKRGMCHFTLHWFQNHIFKGQLLFVVIIHRILHATSVWSYLDIKFYDHFIEVQPGHSFLTLIGGVGTERLQRH